MNSDRPYINRRGHTLEVSDDELQSLQLDKDQSPEVASVPAVGPQPSLSDMSRTDPKPRRRGLKPPRLTKRRALVIVMIVALAAAILLGGGELVRARYASAGSAAVDGVGRIAAITINQQKQANLTSGDMNAVIDELAKLRDGLCVGGLWDNIATLYPRANQAHKSCNTTKQRVSDLVLVTQRLRGQLDYLEQIDKALKPVVTAENGQFAVISAQLESWRRVEKSLEDIQAPAELTTAHAKLIKRAGDIQAGWLKFSSATNDQDSKAFRSSQDDLNKRYQEFRSSADDIRLMIDDTQSTLTSSYQTLQ